MNLPNKLTVLRMGLVPIFVVLLMSSQSEPAQILSALVFAAASFTDWLDGYYARKHQLITDFGKLMDPIADKLLVMSALIGLVAQGRAPWLCAMVVLGREFVVSGVRLVAASKGQVIAAGWAGKVKTVTQMISILLLLVGGLNYAFQILGEIGLWISTALAIWSLVEYIWKNKGVFTE